jgi:hypothetical protein
MRPCRRGLWDSGPQAAFEGRESLLDDTRNEPPLHLGPPRSYRETPMRFSAFEPTKVLGRLNLAAVALSLAGVTAATVSLALPGRVALVSGVSTLGFGALWVLILQKPWSNGTGRWGSRWGLLSVLLAPLNAATICGFLNAIDPSAVLRSSRASAPE